MRRRKRSNNLTLLVLLSKSSAEWLDGRRLISLYIFLDDFVARTYDYMGTFTQINTRRRKNLFHKCPRHGEEKSVLTSVKYIWHGVGFILVYGLISPASFILRLSLSRTLLCLPILVGNEINEIVDRATSYKKGKAIAIFLYAYFIKTSGNTRSVLIACWRGLERSRIS
jgi:hypothetical protein